MLGNCSGVLSWNFGRVFEGRDLQMWTFKGPGRSAGGGPAERGPAEGGRAQGVSGGGNEKNQKIQAFEK